MSKRDAELIFLDFEPPSRSRLKNTSQTRVDALLLMSIAIPVLV